MVTTLGNLPSGDQPRYSERTGLHIPLLDWCIPLCLSCVRILVHLSVRSCQVCIGQLTLYCTRKFHQLVEFSMIGFNILFVMKKLCHPHFQEIMQYLVCLRNRAEVVSLARSAPSDHWCCNLHKEDSTFEEPGKVHWSNKKWCICVIISWPETIVCCWLWL